MKLLHARLVHQGLTQTEETAVPTAQQNIYPSVPTKPSTENFTPFSCTGFQR